MIECIICNGDCSVYYDDGYNLIWRCDACGYWEFVTEEEEKQIRGDTP